MLAWKMSGYQQTQVKLEHFVSLQKNSVSLQKRVLVICIPTLCPDSSFFSFLPVQQDSFH